MTLAARLVTAELAALRGRRLAVAAAVSAVGSLVGGLAMGALLLPFAEASPVEASTVVVSRGSAAPTAIAVLAALAVAAPYRDGSWMHAALGVPSPVARLVAGAVPIAAIAMGLGAIAVGAAAAGAAVVHPVALGALPLAGAAHVGAIAIWTVWMLGLAHASRSPALTLALGAGLPLVVEPAIAGLLAHSAAAEARWLLPALALRSLAELPVGDGSVLDGPPPELAPAIGAAAVCWTAVAAVAAWLRARGPLPR